MNLWLRLVWLLTTLRLRPPLALPDGVSRLNLRVWPLDLDAVGHMNNGRYLTIMDLGRFDMVLRSGLWSAVMRHKWMPVGSAIKIRYRREMRLFEPFVLETRIVAWEQLYVVMEQVFRFASGPKKDQVAAHALFKGGFYDRKARQYIPVKRLMDEMGVTAASPPITPEVEAFLKADDELKRATAERA